MKKILSLLLISCNLSAFACGGGVIAPKWSIGVIGYGNMYMPHSGMHSFFLPGVQFTHTSPYSVWSERAAFEHMKLSYVTPDFPPGSADMMYVEGYESRNVLRMGVERSWRLHPLFHPYAALDLAGQIIKSDIRYSGFAGVNERDEVSTKGIGLLPAVGFKTFIGKKIAIYGEYRAEAFLNDVDKKVTNYWGNVDTRPTSETEFTFKAGSIVQAGVQVFF